MYFTCIIKSVHQKPSNVINSGLDNIMILVEFLNILSCTEAAKD